MKHMPSAAELIYATAFVLAREAKELNTSPAPALTHLRVHVSALGLHFQMQLSLLNTGPCTRTLPGQV